MIAIIIVIIIIVMGVGSAIALIFTSIPYYLLLKCKNEKAITPLISILTKCDTGNNTSILVIDISSDITGIAARFTSYVLFTKNVFYNRKKNIGKYFNMKIKSLWFLFISSIFLFNFASAVTEPIFSNLRDTKYDNNTDINYTNSGFQLIRTHAAIKFFSYFSMLFLSLCSAQIFYNLSLLWKESKKKVSKRQFQEKLYNLYYDYVKTGKEISSVCNALSEWILIMYLQSFIFLLLNLVNIAQVVRIVRDLEGEFKQYDFLATVINIIIHNMAFLLPYCMAYKLNSAHQAYHKEFVDSYLGLEVVLDGPGNTYKCIPGCKPEKVTQQQSEVELPKLEQLEPTETSPLLESENVKLAEEKYKDYFKNLSKSFILKKVDEFDFVPSICNLNVPLKSLLYTFTAVISIVCFALSSELLVSDY